jgi:hypothetical protein
MVALLRASVNGWGIHDRRPARPAILGFDNYDAQMLTIFVGLTLTHAH